MSNLTEDEYRLLDYAVNATDCGFEDVVETVERIIDARLAPIRALADEWRYKGEFGWGAWQEGQGPDLEGWVLDIASSHLRAALDAASAPVSAQQDHDGTEGQRDAEGTLYAPPLPLVQSGGTAWTEQDWWHTTADQRWGEDRQHTPIDDAWAKCWAYIEERHLSPRECQIVWPIANAVMHSILPTEETR